MSRKKLTNKDKFVFKETEFVNHRGSLDISQQSSVQKRLFPKAGTNKPASNPSTSSSVSPPCIPIRSTLDDGIGPGGDHIIIKDLTTDPCVEEVVEKLSMLNIESLRITVNVKDGPQHRRIQMFPINPLPAVNSKKVLLQVVPNSTSQDVLHPFKADHKKIDVSKNNNYALNNNKDLKMSFTKKPKEIPTFNENANAIKSISSPLTWKGPVLFKPGSTLSPPAPDKDKAKKQDSISVRKVLENDQQNKDFCICVRPLKLILCPVCSYTTSGRLRKTCKVHPKAVYLLDLDACPRCKETNKFVLKEYDLPKGFKQVLNNFVA